MINAEYQEEKEVSTKLYDSREQLEKLIEEKEALKLQLVVIYDQIRITESKIAEYEDRLIELSEK